MLPTTQSRRTVEALVKALVLPGVGSGRLREAIRKEGGAIDAVRALAAEAWPKLTEGERQRVAGWARRAIQTIQRDGVHVLHEASPAYPERLRHLADPPCVLFARGRLDLLQGPSVAVVGTRNASEYGRAMAARIAGAISAAGTVVISGLARGIDGAAHRAAGASRTVGVLGCGIDVVYPRQHRDLQMRIGRDGLLLTEVVPGGAPAAHNFPRRNRILAALAEGVVVIDAPQRSGALITARMALELGRPVFVVPGPVTDRRSEGGNGLIRDGAALVTSAAEVLEPLGLPLPPPGAEEDVAPDGLDGVGLALWRQLRHAPRHVDEIAAAVGLEPHHSLASLLALEIQGHARQHPGLRFARVRGRP